ncbi:MAG: N-acetyltransferase [Sandaracinus sp.]|nr:N-acetyltransferase [Sandaracinus sp.]
MSVVVEHRVGKPKGAWVVEVEGERLAEMTYSWAGDDMFILDHTHVDDRLRGQGVGGKLVAAAVAYARENHVGILPLCPFAKSVFDRTPEYADVRR